MAKLSDLIPLNIVSTNITCPSVAKIHIHEIIEMCNIDMLQPADMILQEMFMWASKWKDTNFLDLPASIDEALFYAKQETYPNIRALFKIFFTIPCITASVKRSFSNLKTLKTYL